MDFDPHDDSTPFLLPRLLLTQVPARNSLSSALTTALLICRVFNAAASTDKAAFLAEALSLALEAVLDFERLELALDLDLRLLELSADFDFVEPILLIESFG